MDGCMFRFFVSTAVVLLSGAFPILPSHTARITDTHLCSTPMGMESRAINDSALSASSFYFNSVGPTKARLNTEDAGGAWCPKDPISVESREWLQVSLNGTHLISGVQLQGRFGHGRGQEYTEEFEIEYWRKGMQFWRKYYRFDGKTVLPGNSDTSTVTTTKLLPPLLAEKIRILPYAKYRRTVCIRMELLGCPMTGGVMQYITEQGHIFSEGISLKDESYDGQGTKWDRRVVVDIPSDSNQNNIVNIFRQSSSKDSDSFNFNEINFDEMNNNNQSEEQMLFNGLGELTDTIEGPNSFAMDIAYGLGNGWVGWKMKPNGVDYIQILFEFNEVREFSSVDLYTNNYPSKDIQIFGRVKVYFSLGGMYFNGKSITYIPEADGALAFENAHNVTIPLESRIGRFIKLHLHFRSSWILLGEVYFNSDIYTGNYTLELRPDSSLDFPDTQSSLEIGDLDASMVETVVGIISGLILLLSIVAGLIIWMRRNGRSISSAFQFHANAFPLWRNTWSSVPTHIVTQSDPTTEGVKDLLLTLTPIGKGVGGNTVILNGDFKSRSPPPYKNGTVDHKNSNGLKLQGDHRYNYGSLHAKNSVDNEKGSLCPGEYSSRTINIRSNKLASADNKTEYADADDESIYRDASTLNVNSNNSSLRTVNRKLRIANCVWNLSSEGGRSFRNHQGRLLPEVSLRQLRLIENLGSCLYGQVHLYDFEGEIACPEGTLYRNCRIIAKTIKSMPEIRLLSVLDHEHVLAMIGLCREMKKPLIALYPAPECGDLCSFLSRLTNTPSLSWLLRVGAQIASGMNYLESLCLIHRDLAARNCLMEREGSIRISDLAMACGQYREDYCHTSKGLAPFRWWSWESILTDEFTMQSCVWSFGVTLWEILTLCRQKPIVHVSDHQIRPLAEEYGSSASNEQLVWLPQPLLSSPEIYELMRECWQKNPMDRPTFQHISLFLEQKCSNTTAVYHIV